MAGKKRNASSVKPPIERKLWKQMLITSGDLYLYNIVFSLFSLVFLAVPAWAQILVGVLFEIPPVILIYGLGKSLGENDYKLRNNAILSDIHTRRIVPVNYARVLLYALPFICSALLLGIIGAACKFVPLQLIMSLIFCSVSLIFFGSKAMEVGVASWFSLLSVAISVVLSTAGLLVGYIRAIRTLRGRATELINEMRSFE